VIRQGHQQATGLKGTPMILNIASKDKSLEQRYREQKLADYQQEMQDFTTFLKQRYWAPVEEEAIRL
jgi:hypothetical protein